jgi:hypothetical protein
MSQQLHRAVEELHRVGREYPEAWKAYDQFREARRELGDWPEYAFCPMAAAYAVASGRGAGRVSPERGTDIARLAALAAWRPTQGIYRYAPALLDALRSTPVAGDLPVEVLRHLPEWCVYVELARPGEGLGFLHGAWAHLEFDANTRHEELRLLLDSNDGLLPVALHLVGTLDEALQAFATRARVEAVAMGLPDVTARAKLMRMPELRPVLEPVVSVLLYLCAAAAELRDPRDAAHRPARPRGHRDKHVRLRCFAAERATVWETGTRLGAALELAQRQAREGESTGTGPSVMPHIRRAHWHTYWVGAGDVSCAGCRPSP